VALFQRDADEDGARIANCLAKLMHSSCKPALAPRDEAYDQHENDVKEDYQ
jgi:hypothetical protein